MAGTVVLTEKNYGEVVRHTFAWTSDASGNVSYAGQAIASGRLIAVRIVPGASASQPSDQYDVELRDDDGIDLLGGEGANQSNSTGSVFSFDPPLFQDHRMGIVVSNAGNAKSGTVEVYRV